MTRFPVFADRLGLGLGLDLPWGAPIGFREDGEGGGPSEKVVNFLRHQSPHFAYFFFSFQPRSQNFPHLDEYQSAYARLLELLPRAWPVALHQTTMNLGTLERYDRETVVAFTNHLIETCGIRWVNEDLGIWSLQGKSLPYPLAPFLNEEGYRASVANVGFYQARLKAPLLVEFPGFSDGSNFFIGRQHAYDFFRGVVEETDSPCTLDVGHLLAYQWLRGKRGEELYAELERLPLRSCFEIHLSGCQIVRDRFLDYHHGILMDEQLVLLERLLPLCPNAKAITFEDPKFDDEGTLIEKSRPNFQRLQEIVRAWKT